MAVIWERVDPDGVSFVYDTLPALGGDFTLGGRQPGTSAPELNCDRSDAELDTIGSESAAILARYPLFLTHTHRVLSPFLL